MGFGSFYKGEKKKPKKTELKKGVTVSTSNTFVLPQVEIIKKGKKMW